MEAEYPLDPLPLGGAVELFLDRARAVSRKTEPSAEIEEICRRLDGLPLALELAAARLKLLDPAELLDRLDSSLSLLTRGPADAPERQRTLEATIAWSYDLLQADERETFARLSVFAGTFDLAAAASVADADLDVLTTLVDASLLKSRGDSRFLMLETIREFGREHVPPEESASLARRHAEHYLALAEAAAPNLTGQAAEMWLGRLDADNGNLRKAFDWFEHNEPQEVARLTISLWRFWLVRGRYDEGQTAIERALLLSPSAVEHAELLYQLGAIVNQRGDAASSRAFFQESLTRFREQGLPSGEARSLGALGHAAADAGERDEAIELYEAAATGFRSTGDRFGLGGVLSDLATVHVRAGSPAQALPLAAESLTLQREVGNRPGEALALAIQGYAELGLGNLGPARRALAESTEIAHRVGYRHGLVFSLNGLAALAHRTGDDARAAPLFAAAEALRDSMGIEHDPDEALVAGDRDAVAGAGRSGSIGSGEELDLDRVVALALHQ
jgi:tetratricopeptide (TPR) repeat protein